MTVTVYQQTATGIVLQNALNVVVQLRVPNTGTYLVLGRVTVENTGTTPVNVNSVLSTLDGATVLDEALVSVAPGVAANQVCVALQGTLNVTAPSQNEIVDIRCASLNATANSCSLIAISVDQLSGSV
jgi:hypothetical protein